jgi:glycine oxidase
MNSTERPTLVVGAGIIGLTSAFRLALAGHEVTLFDPTPARGATWAAAGMLAPSAEISPGEESNYEMQKGAVSAWRQMAADLLVVTGSTLEIHDTGTLIVGWDASDRRLIDQFSQVAATFHADCRPVSRTETPEIFDRISPRMSEGLLLSGDAWLDPDKAVALLSEALEKLRVSIIREEVLRVCGDEQGVIAETASGSFRGSSGILATGHLGLPAGAVASGPQTIRPVHGVTARVQGVDRADLPTIRAFVRGRTFYMVSRPGGYCVLGATAEERTEPTVQVGELQRLLRDGLDVVPELETARVLESRVGLRPASPDLRPFFERIDTCGWAWSSGHYRHGVTLAPIAAGQALAFVEGGA